MDCKLKPSLLHTVSLRCVSRSLSQADHIAQIEQRSSLRRVVNGISCCMLAIATALLVGCNDSLSSGSSLSGGGSLGGDGLGAPQQAPTPPPSEPSATLCSSGLAAQDLSGQCRANPPTMGALETGNGTSAAGITVASLTVSPTASHLLQVSWQPFGNNTSGYMVYYGITAESTNASVSDLPTNSGLIDPAAPSVTYDSVRDLGLFVGDTVCFRIHAYNLARTDIAEAFLGCSTV